MCVYKEMNYKMLYMVYLECVSGLHYYYFFLKREKKATKSGSQELCVFATMFPYAIN